MVRRTHPTCYYKRYEGAVGRWIKRGKLMLKAVMVAMLAVCLAGVAYGLNKQMGGESIFSFCSSFLPLVGAVFRWPVATAVP